MLLFVLCCVLFSFLSALILDIVAWAIAFLIAAFRKDREQIRAAVRANSGNYKLAWVSCSGWLLVADLWDWLINGSVGKRFDRLFSAMMVLGNEERLRAIAFSGGVAIIYAALCYWAALPWDGFSVFWMIATGFVLVLLVAMNFGRLLDIAEDSES